MAMAALAQQSVESAVDAYLQRDKGLCQYVKRNETAINTAQRELDEMAYELLAKEQPMAIDLRFSLAVQALLEGDARLADSVREMDDEIDRMNRRAHLDLLQLIQEKPEYTQQALIGILVARNLERIADHASNIATDVIFWIRGADVRHQLSVSMD